MAIVPSRQPIGTPLPAPPVFLTARWQWLIMLNFTIDPDVLTPLVPRGVELDAFQGRHYVSVVGFQFLDTRVRGLAIPFHVNFEELNLRFYVVREAGGEIRRGVTFIKEIVPRRAISWAARRFYNENYVTLPMRHRHRFVDETPASLRYQWRHAGRWEHVAAEAVGQAELPAEGSEAAFITEHYWGYTAQRDGGTLEYQVEHRPWRVWQAANIQYECQAALLYGPQFAEALGRPPASAQVVDGSAVQVRTGVRL